MDKLVTKFIKCFFMKNITSISLRTKSSVTINFNRYKIIISLFKIPDAIKMNLDKQNIQLFDIESKKYNGKDSDLTKEISLFLSRYGIRF